MKRRIIIAVSLLFAAALILAGCASSSDSATTGSVPQEAYSKTEYSMDIADEAGFGEAEDYAYEETMAETTSSYDDTSDAIDISEKIIYNVYATLSTDDVQFAVDSITAKAKSLGGYISYSNTYTSGGYVYANIEIRVPAGNLTQMEEHTTSLGTVQDRTLSTENITDSYYDIVGRLASAEAEEEQLLLILEKAETIEDILLVREQLSSVQAQIESYKGKIRLWDSLVDYSTLTYNIRPIPTIDTEDETPRIIKIDETWRAMKNGFRNSAIAVANFFSYFFRFLAILAIPLSLLGIIAFIVIVIVKHSNKKRKEKIKGEKKE